MEAALQIIRELSTLGDRLMWIAGPGDMVSENYSRGIQEPQVHGKYVMARAHNWFFHLEPEMAEGIEFVEKHGDLASHYVRFADRQGEILLRACLPRPRSADADSSNSRGNPKFEKLGARFAGHDGVEPVRRAVRSPARK